jgi:hypothetical protein
MGEMMEVRDQVRADSDAVYQLVEAAFLALE